MTDLSGSWRTGADLTDHPWAGATVAEATLEDCDLTRIQAIAGTWRHTVVNGGTLRGAEIGRAHV